MPLRLRPDVSVTSTAAGIVLLDERSGRYWQLNRSGSVTLRTLLEGGTPSQAAQQLSNSYRITSERAAADIGALLDALRHARLVIP
ncbi:MAG: lasso peptide biosynthesis PqqD family chaperone [Pseudonocardiaceae bacterium]